MVDYATKFKQIVDLAMESKSMVMDVNNVSFSEQLSHLEDFAFSIAKIIEFKEEAIAFENIAEMIIDLQKKAFANVLSGIEEEMYFENLLNSIEKMKVVA